MKILILSNSDMGLFRFRSELIGKLAENNEVFVSVPDNGYAQKFENMGCKIVVTGMERRGTNPLKDFSLMKFYKNAIKQTNPDVVLTYTVKPNIYGGMACKSMKVPYIANITGLGTAIENGGVLAKIVQKLYKLALKKASCVFFQNSANKDLFVKNKIVSSHLRTIPGSGVNLDFHSFTEYPAESDETNFLFIGRVMKDKGINELISAAKTVKEKYPDTTVTVVGGFDDNYEGIISAAEKENIIQYAGRQDDVRPFIRRSHCTVLPSYHEGTANVLLESASTGRPVIASRVPGCRETFDENITGFGCEVKDADSLAEAMIKFIELPYEEKKKMGIGGRKKIEREYDRRIVIDAYMEEIDKAVNKNQ